jgi:hypothetical protein
MKQSVSFVFFYFLIFTVSAQFLSPTKVIGTHFQFYTTKTVHEDPQYLESLVDKSTSFSFRPYYGKVKQSNKMFGAGIGYTHINSTKYEKEEDFVWTVYKYKNIDKVHHFSAYGFMRFYKFLTPEIGAFFQLWGEVGYGNYDNRITESPVDYSESLLKHIKTDLYDFSLISNVGVLYQVNEWLGLELNYGNFGFTYLITKANDNLRPNFETKTNKTSGLGFDFGTSTIFIGANFYLTRKIEEE